MAKLILPKTAKAADSQTKPRHRDKAYYLGLSPESRISNAVEMAAEIAADRGRYYCLASAIVDHLTSGDDGESADPVALGLAEVLEELLGSTAQQIRLADCLEAMAEVCHG